MLEQRVARRSSPNLIGPGLQAIYYYLTFACNLRCLHCYVGENLSPQSHAKPATVANTLRECYAHGARKAIFLGGEATLHPSYAEILATAAEIGYRRIVVDTNGLARDPIPQGADYLDRLTIRLSFEGATPETHDVIRGQGAFKGALETLRRLIRQSVRVEVTLTLNAINLPELPGMIDRFLDRGVREFNFHFISLMGNANLHRWLGLYPEQIIHAQALLEDFRRRNVATVRYPRLIVPVEELQRHLDQGCNCRIFDPAILLIFPQGEMRRCPLEITAGLVPQFEISNSEPFAGCPLSWRLLPDGVPEGYAMTCISWKDH
jgi:MoaA/NifB/PqqE/SkfB family radical SAM enzyme